MGCAWAIDAGKLSDCLVTDAGQSRSGNSRVLPAGGALCTAGGGSKRSKSEKAAFRTHAALAVIGARLRVGIALIFNALIQQSRRPEGKTGGFALVAPDDVVCQVPITSWGLSKPERVQSAPVRPGKYTPAHGRPGTDYELRTATVNKQNRRGRSLFLFATLTESGYVRTTRDARAFSSRRLAGRQCVG